MIDENEIKNQIWSLLEKLFPIHRTLINDGYDKSLQIIREELELEIECYKSGQKVWDWIIPNSWNVNEAYIEDKSGDRLVDFKKSNLHLSAYSEAFSGMISHEELMEHLNYLPDQPDAIPFNYLYYEQGWSFNISYESLKRFRDREYKVHIDVDERPGELQVAQCYLPGQIEDEVLFSTYLCHPSMANDNLSGVVTGVELFKHLSQFGNRKYSYRLLIMPETIGPITYLSNHMDRIEKIVGGFVLYCCGDKGNVTYKKSYAGNSYIDRVAAYVCDNYAEGHNIMEYFPGGSDERQYNAPGLRLPVGAFMRTPGGKFPEYHTSKDDLTVVSRESLFDTFRLLLKAVDVLEIDRMYTNKYMGEPFFSKHNIQYPTQLEGIDVAPSYYIKILSSEIDGSNSLLDISQKWKIPLDILAKLAGVLLEAGLIEQ